MHATLLNGCVVGEYSMVGAQTLVPEGRTYPSRSLLVGSPARVVRALTDEEIERIIWVRGRYTAPAAGCTPSQGFGADLSAFRG